MPEKTQQMTIKRAFSLIEGLRSKVSNIEKDIRALKDLLNVHDNWHALVRTWRGKEVSVKDNCGEVSKGTLKWTDRYNVAVETNGRERVYTKGGIVFVERDGD
jgi:hypothetical protein